MKHKSKFTLIELLVVVAIIGILMTMLLPALRSARGIAQRSVCQSNIKQITFAAHEYSNDYDEHIPSISNSAPGSYQWWDLLGEVSGDTDPVRATGYLPWKRGEYNSDGIFKCPAASQINPKWFWVARFDAHYGLNNNLSVLWNDGKPLRMTVFPRPSDTIAYGDGKILYYSTNSSYYFISGIHGGNSSEDPDSLPYMWKYPEFRCHNLTVNLSCLDGHVEVFSRKSPPGAVTAPGGNAGDRWRKFRHVWGNY